MAPEQFVTAGYLLDSEAIFMYYIFMQKKFLILFLLSSIVFMCSKNNNLEPVKLLIQNGEYDTAIRQLDTILDKDSGNVEANELRIRATMLRKSDLRNHNMRPAVSTDKKDAAGVGGAAPAGNAKFSIMSLCGDGNGPELNRIQQQLNAKKVN